LVAVFVPLDLELERGIVARGYHGGAKTVTAEIEVGAGAAVFLTVVARLL